jgi:transposase
MHVHICYTHICYVYIYRHKNYICYAHKIRLYPTKEQNSKLQKWFGVTRWTYNRCVSAIKNKQLKANKKSLQAYTINEDAIRTEFPWAMKIPYDIRYEGMTDIIKAIKSNHKMKFFELKYRTIRDAHQNIVVPKKHTCNNVVFILIYLGRQVSDRLNRYH